MSKAASRKALFSAAVLLLAPLAAACGTVDEQATPQFPHGQTIGTDDPPRGDDPDERQEEVHPAYAQTSDVEVREGQRETVVIGGEGDEAIEGQPQQQLDEYPDADPSALSDFHSTLDPYGTWVDDSTYGTIWQPSVSAVGSDFAPYETAGHWSYGDNYVWVSDYSWGWAPFHYGRWVYATHGWGWIPGRQYAGAWTTWRNGYGAYEGYVGWAPLPPTWYWRNGVAVGIGVVPPAAYGFCRTGDLFASSLHGRMVTGPDVGAIGAHSHPTIGAVTANGRYGGRTLAHPEVAGPSPASMRIARNAVVRVPRSNAGLRQANRFARPSTAMALGGHAPAGWSPNVHVASAARPFSSSMGTNAYGSMHLGGETRTLAGGYDRTYVGGHAISSFRGGGFRGAYTYGHGGGAHVGQFHGGGVHGGVAPAHQPYYGSYGGGYHPSGGGGHFGGHGGGGRGGGHR